MGSWGPFVLWLAVLGAITTLNAYRYVVRVPELYWIGAAMFGAGGILATYYHHGVDATVWGAVAIAGWLCYGVGLCGFPPRMPSLRARKSS